MKPLTVIEIRHSILLAEPLRYALDHRDWTVTDENGDPQTFISQGFDAESADLNNEGVDSRQLAVADPDLALWDVINDNIGGTEPVTIIQREYDKADTSAPISVSVMQLDGASLSMGNVVSLSASTSELNFAAPYLRFTSANSPQLRR